MSILKVAALALFVVSTIDLDDDIRLYGPDDKPIDDRLVETESARTFEFKEVEEKDARSSKSDRFGFLLM